MSLSTILIIFFLIGFSSVFAGIFLNKYPSRTQSKLTYLLKFKQCNSLINRFFTWLAKNEKNFINRAEKRMLDQAESKLDVKSLYIIKAGCLVTAFILLLMIQFTNMDLLREKILINVFKGNNLLFLDNNANEIKYNIRLYKIIVDEAGERNLKTLDKDKKLKIFADGIRKFSQIKNESEINLKSQTMLKAFDSSNMVVLIDYKFFVYLLAAFFLPEFYLIAKRILLGNLYKKEVIKLENVFELLGSIPNYKTIDILQEMKNSGKTYSKHFENCIQIFKTEREKALDNLKSSVGNKRFAKLVDVLRIYCTIDKKLAMDILRRNCAEKEEHALLTAEEDTDLIDITAMLSITPVLWVLANLFLSPMLKIINDAFNFI